MFCEMKKLSNGVEIPVLALGTWFIDDDKAADTANPEHMKSNAAVDFVITDEDMEILKHVEKIKDYGEYGFFPGFGGKL